MNCDECHKTIPTYPCACGYQPTPAVSPLPPVRPCATPDGITKEQFGRHLYDTITTIGGMMGLAQQRAAAIHHGEGYKVQSLLRRRRELQSILAAQLPTLDHDEMDQILTRYPWVTAC
jgi:hypothetical protein